MKAAQFAKIDSAKCIIDKNLKIFVSANFPLYSILSNDWESNIQFEDGSIGLIAWRDNAGS